MWGETFVARMYVVQGGVKFRAKEATVKEKPAVWKRTHFCLRCCEERVVLCVDGQWGRCRICCVTVGMTGPSKGLLIRSTSVLPCLPTMEQQTVVPMLQRNAQHTGCANVNERCVQ